MPDTITIALGGRDFTVRPLTIGQLRTIYPAIFQGAALGTPDGYDKAVRCIATALQADHPEVTPEALEALPTTIPELSAAFVAVMTLAGLKMGEAKAGAD
jgi:hypothetical protein